MEAMLKFIFNLHHLRPTDLSRMRFSFAAESIWWAVPAVIALAILGYWSYQRQSASPAKRLAMGLLRATTLVLVLVLFLKPSLVLEQETCAQLAKKNKITLTTI